MSSVQELLTLQIHRKTKRINWREVIILKSENEIKELKRELTLAEKDLTYLKYRLHEDEVALELCYIKQTNINMSKLGD